MILALNIGNSNITFGSYTKDGKLVFSSRLFADTALSSDELLYKMVNMLALYGAEPREITDVIFSSVVPALTPRMLFSPSPTCKMNSPALRSASASSPCSMSRLSALLCTFMQMRKRALLRICSSMMPPGFCVHNNRCMPRLRPMRAARRSSSRNCACSSLS